MSKTKTKYQRRSYTSEEALTCAGCKGTIAAGESFWRGVTKEPWHKSCKRHGVNVARPTPKRFLHDDPVGQDCGGCGMEIYEDDKVAHVLARPWHKECVLRR